jgi:hypothetical protein
LLTDYIGCNIKCRMNEEPVVEEGSVYLEGENIESEIFFELILMQDKREEILRHSGD